MRRLGAVMLFGFFLAATGCGGYIGNAQRAYQDGRFLEAAETLGEHEDEVGEMPLRKQADYGLYRGLSLMALGDHDGAAQWLGFTASLEQKRPGTLRSEQLQALEEGLTQLSRVTPPPPAEDTSSPPVETAVPASPAALTPAPARWDRAAP
ncbi:hypothetical protein [Polyangium aurulentum]|uniref:hypothetical protein n=1 Tax=Polyangium aurulentum TaxID=2567896 RepID=UPI0010AE1D91|nr:hypothetical protein [Polyangium aurulentum]UQA59594.1 hypothetical protein E8A73_003530 [Polyangium aurulentum]